MISKSKTGDKLVASIRKSKTGTVAGKHSERPDAAESTAKPKSTPASSPSVSETAKPTSKTATNEDRGYLFNHGRRVWPD